MPSVVRAAGDDRDVARARVSPQAAGHLPAVHDGHREVGDDDVRDEIAGLLETVSAVPRLGNNIAVELEGERVQLPRVVGVLDYQRELPRHRCPSPWAPAPSMRRLAARANGATDVPGLDGITSAAPHLPLRSPRSTRAPARAAGDHRKMI